MKKEKQQKVKKCNIILRTLDKWDDFKVDLKTKWENRKNKAYFKRRLLVTRCKNAICLDKYKKGEI